MDRLFGPMRECGIERYARMARRRPATARNNYPNRVRREGEPARPTVKNIRKAGALSRRRPLRRQGKSTCQGKSRNDKVASPPVRLGSTDARPPRRGYDHFYLSAAHDPALPSYARGLTTKRQFGHRAVNDRDLPLRPFIDHSKQDGRSLELPTAERKVRVPIRPGRMTA